MFSLLMDIYIVHVKKKALSIKNFTYPLDTTHTILYCSLYVRYHRTKHNMEKKKKKNNKTGTILHVSSILASWYFSVFNIALRTFVPIK